MSEETAVVVQDYDVKGTALERWGQRAEVREAASRLMTFHQAAAEVGQPGMLAVAHLALMVGASPLPSTNEIHVFVNKGKVRVDLGINYFRRRARELGGILWEFEPRVMTEKEYQGYGVNPKTHIGAVCRACRVSDVKLLMEVLNIKADLAFEEAMRRSGRTGVGTVGVNARAKEGRPLSWTACKAAEKDICRALFPNLEQPTPEEQQAILDSLPHYEPGDDEYNGETLNGHEAERLAELREATERAEKVMQAMTPEEQAAKVEENGRLLHGDPDFEGFDTPPEPPPEEELPEAEDNLQPGDTPDLTNATAEDLYGPADNVDPLDIQTPTQLMEALGPLEYYKSGRHALGAYNKITGNNLRTWPNDLPEFYVGAYELLTAYAQEQTAQQTLPGV